MLCSWALRLFLIVSCPANGLIATPESPSRVKGRLVVFPSSVVLLDHLPAAPVWLCQRDRGYAPWVVAGGGRCISPSLPHVLGHQGARAAAERKKNAKDRRAVTMSLEGTKMPL